MCNLYRMSKSAAEIGSLFEVQAAENANFGAEVYPGYPGLVIADGSAQTMVWGFPLSLKGKSGQLLKPKPGTPSPAFTAIAPAAAQPLPARPTLATANALIPQTAAQAPSKPVPPVASIAVARQPDLGALMSKTALYVERPHELDDGTVISEFTSSGNELLMIAAVPQGTGAFSDYTKQAATKAICTRRAFAPLLQGGATIRARYLGSGKKQVGEVTVTTANCLG